MVVSSGGLTEAHYLNLSNIFFPVLDDKMWSSLKLLNHDLFTNCMEVSCKMFPPLHYQLK